MVYLNGKTENWVFLPREHMQLFLINIWLNTIKMDPELYGNLSMKKKDKAILKIWDNLTESHRSSRALDQTVYSSCRQGKEGKGKRKREVWSGPGWRHVHFLREHKQRLERKEKHLKNDNIACQSHLMQWPCDPEFPRGLQLSIFFSLN